MLPLTTSGAVYLSSMSEDSDAELCDTLRRRSPSVAHGTTPDVGVTDNSGLDAYTCIAGCGILNSAIGRHWRKCNHLFKSNERSTVLILIDT